MIFFLQLQIHEIKISVLVLTVMTGKPEYFNLTFYSV